MLGLSPASQPAGATWPGSNGLIAFVSNRDAGPDIYTMDSAGGNVTRLTFTSTQVYDPHWSASGAKIVFEQIAGGHGEIFTMAADGSNQVRRTHLAADSWAANWSPDGSKIVFISNKQGGTYDLWVMKANGTNVHRLVALPGFEEWPSFSPNGKKILFDSDREGDNKFDLWVVRADGTHPKQLTQDPNSVESSWGPNGQTITFETNRPDNTANFQLYSMNTDGTGQVPIFVDAAHNYYGPSYSPDATKLVYYAGPGLPANEIYVADANGTGAVDISNNAAADYSPSWQPT
jgi:Tol biopolymer transport system component